MYLSDTWTHCCSDVSVTMRHCYGAALVKQIKVNIDLLELEDFSHFTKNVDSKISLWS